MDYGGNDTSEIVRNDDECRS